MRKQKIRGQEVTTTEIMQELIDDKEEKNSLLSN